MSDDICDAINVVEMRARSHDAEVKLMRLKGENAALWLAAHALFHVIPHDVAEEAGFIDALNALGHALNTTEKK